MTSNLYKKPLYWLTGILFLSGMGGCTQETELRATSEGDKALVRFSLEIGSEKRFDSGDASTKGASPWDGKGIYISFDDRPEVTTRADVEETIDNLWLFQYATEGKFAGQLIAYARVSSGSLTEVSAGVYTFSAELVYSDACEIIAVANATRFGYDESLVSLSAAKMKVHTFSSQDDNPLTGIYSGSVPNDNLWIAMERIKAKMRLRIINDPQEGSFTLQSIGIKNVPRIGRYYNTAREDDSWIFPAVSSTVSENQAVFERDYIAVSSGLDGSEVEAGTYYLAENRRGTVDGISGPQEKWMENSPTYNVDGMETSYATHIVMAGSYTTASGSTDPRVRTATITFFPGKMSDADRNFDIVRNNYYDITVHLGTIAEDDPRIELSPTITYMYYYQDNAGTESFDGKTYTYFAQTYHPGILTAGDEFPVPTSDILQAKWSEIPVSNPFVKTGAYAVWTTRSISEIDSYNVLKVYYNFNYSVLKSPVPTITYPDLPPSTGGIVSAGGTGEAGATITIYWPNDTTDTTVVEEDDNWNFDIPIGETRGLREHAVVKATQIVAGYMESDPASITINGF